MLWKNYQISQVQKIYFKIGPLSLWLKRNENELTIYFLHHGDKHDRNILIDESYKDEIPKTANSKRYFIPRNAKEFSLGAVVPDNDIIFRPNDSLYVPPNTTMHLYVNTSLWPVIKIKGHEIFRVPIVTLQETWLGADPTNGELCFAGITKGVLTYKDIVHFPYRFVCRFNIINEDDETLQIERIRMLTDLINIYGNEETEEYFSDEIEMKIIEGRNLKIKTQSPNSKKVNKLKKIIVARKTSDHFISRAFSSIMS